MKLKKTIISKIHKHVLWKKYRKQLFGGDCVKVRITVLKVRSQEPGTVVTWEYHNYSHQEFQRNFRKK